MTRPFANGLAETVVPGFSQGARDILKLLGSDQSPTNLCFPKTAQQTNSDRNGWSDPAPYHRVGLESPGSEHGERQSICPAPLRRPSTIGTDTC